MRTTNVPITDVRRPLVNIFVWFHQISFPYLRIQSSSTPRLRKLSIVMIPICLDGVTSWPNVAYEMDPKINLAKHISLQRADGVSGVWQLPIRESFDSGTAYREGVSFGGGWPANKNKPFRWTATLKPPHLFGVWCSWDILIQWCQQSEIVSWKPKCSFKYGNNGGTYLYLFLYCQVLRISNCRNCSSTMTSTSAEHGTLVFDTVLFKLLFNQTTLPLYGRISV